MAKEPFFFCGDWSKPWPWLQIVQRAIYRYGLAVVDWTTYNDPEAAYELQQGLAQFEFITTLKSLRQ